MAPSVVTVRIAARGPDDAADREALLAFTAHVTGADPAQVVVGRRCPHCRRTDHGRPWASVDGRPVGVGLARAPRALALAVGPDPLGIDLERVSRMTAAPLDDAFTPGEHRRAAGDPSALTACWAVKEAVLKHDGRGLRVDPARVDVDLGTGTARLEGDLHPVVVRWLDDDLVLAVRTAATVRVDDHRAARRRGAQPER